MNPEINYQKKLYKVLKIEFHLTGIVYHCSWAEQQTSVFFSSRILSWFCMTKIDHPSQRTTSTQKSQLFNLRRWALQFLISFKNQVLPWMNTLNLQLRVNWLIQSVPCMMMGVVFPTVLKFRKMLKSEVWT